MDADDRKYCESNLNKSKYICVSDQQMDTSEYKCESDQQLDSDEYICVSVRQLDSTEFKNVSDQQLDTGERKCVSDNPPDTSGCKCDTVQLLEASKQSHHVEIQPQTECGLHFDVQYIPQLDKDLTGPDQNELISTESSLICGQPIKQEELPVTPKPYVCLVCAQSYDEITILQQHMMSHTNISCPDIANSSEMIQVSPNFTVDVTMPCSENFVKIENGSQSPGSLKEGQAYHCAQCCVPCWSLAGIQHHLLSHLDVEPYSCHHCDFKSVKQSELKSHLVSHMEVNGFTCSLCGLACSSKSALIRHTILHMNDSEEDGVLPSGDTIKKRCSKKTKVQLKLSDSTDLDADLKVNFQTRSQLPTGGRPRKERVQKFITHGPGSDDSSGAQIKNTWEFNCYETGQSAGCENDQEPVEIIEENDPAVNDTAANLLEDMDYKDGIIDGSLMNCEQFPDSLMKAELSDDTEQADDNFFLDKKNFQCKHCKFSCQSLAYLKRHMKSHTDLKFESCPHCEFSCWTSVQLKEHMVTHSQDGPQCWPFACEKCEFACKTQRELKRHQLIHQRVKVYLCPLCSFTCDQKSALENHRGIHKDTTSFLVDVCKFGDKSQRKLKGRKRRLVKRKVYHCQHCDFKSRTSQPMKKHLQSEHPDRRPYSCDLCPFTCWMAKDLRAHVLIHTGAKPFECTECDYRCRRLTRLREHMLIHRNSKPFKCSVCQHAFRASYYLKRHLELGQCKRQSNIDGPSSPKRFPDVGEGSKPPDEATGIKSIIVADVVADSIADSAKNRDEMGVTQNNPEGEDVKNVILIKDDNVATTTGEIEGTKVAIECDSTKAIHLIKEDDDKDGDNKKDTVVDAKANVTTVVDGQSRVKSAITAVFAEKSFRHERDERGAKLFRCTLCVYTCKKAYHLKRHMFGHSEERSFKCEHCDYATKTEDNLRRHSKRHSGVKPFSCKLCSYTCYELGDLNRHLLTHTDFKAYKCPMCDYAGRTKYHLNEHVMTHSDLKPFLCSVCGKAFSSGSKMREHMFKHTTEKNIQCPECSFKCRRHSELRKHMKKHSDAADDQANEKESQETKIFLCTVCGTSFKYNSALKRHMITHSENRPWQCPHCTFQCRSKDQLNTHVARHQEIRHLACDVCSVTFKHSFSLRRHMLKHTTSDPMSCQSCDFMCFRSYVMKRHMQNKHKLEANPST